MSEFVGLGWIFWWYVVSIVIGYAATRNMLDGVTTIHNSRLLFYGSFLVWWAIWMGLWPWVLIPALILRPFGVRVWPFFRRSGEWDD